MPHQCTNCGHTFADGSKEMLSGCPDCGGNKFQFRPAGSVDPGEAPDAEAPDPPTEREGGLTDAAARAGAAVRDRLSGGGREQTDQSGGARSSETPDTADADDAADTPNSPAAPGRTDAVESADSSGTDTSDGEKSTDSESERRRLDADDRAWPGQSEESAGPDASSPDSADDAEVISDEETAANAGKSETVDSPSQPRDEPGVEHGPESEPHPGEDRAQADARSGTVSEDELSAAAESSKPSSVPESAESPPAANDPEAYEADETAPDSSPDSAPPPDADGTVIEPEDDEKPDLTDLREELNDQFESIKIVNPGQYELNLMELYDREEYIISLQEDGKYVIEVPDRWTDDE